MEQQGNSDHSSSDSVVCTVQTRSPYGQIGSSLPVHFIPTSTDLQDMLANVARKCDAAREANANERMERAWTAEANARRARALWGAP